MTLVVPLVIGECTKKLSADEASFINLTLDNQPIKDLFSPIVEMIAANIEFSYKSPAKIDFCATALPVGQTIFETIQIDDICIKMLHLKSGQAFFIVVDSSLARTLLTRLVASSLIEDVPGLLFSSTEKGIFSFIIARLIVELTRTLGPKMPPLKILGIFHSHDEIIKENSLKEYIAHHFILNFIANRYPVSLFITKQMNQIPLSNTFNEEIILYRCGHIQRDISFIIYRFSVSYKILCSIRAGDLIMFDRTSLSCENSRLQGQIDARWGSFNLSGQLIHKEFKYCFKFIQPQEREAVAMKALEVISDDIEKDLLHDSKTNRFKDLAQTMRVPMSIEISRIPMSLKEIGDLLPGQIIDLQRKVGDPLEIVIENKVIGYCAPVQIDGRLGIKILSID